MVNEKLPTNEVTAYRIGKLETEVYKLQARMKSVFWALVFVAIEMLPASYETLLDVLARGQ